MEIELFRADTRASKGLTAAHIAEAAACYDADKAPAPIVFGHPSNDSPALGLLSSVRAEGSKLFGTLANVAQELVQGVRDRKVLNRSVAFWDPHHPSNPNPGKFSVRHLGFLGGQSPAIPGMAPLRFSADDDNVLEVNPDVAPADAMIFAVETPTGVQTIIEPAPKTQEKEFAVTELEIAQKAAADAKAEAAAEKARADKLQADADNAAATFAASEATRRTNEDAAATQAALDGGQITPAEKKDLDVVFSALSTDALTFSTGDAEPRIALANFLKALPKRAPGNTDTRTTETKEFSANPAAKDEADKAYRESVEAQQNAYKPAA